MKLFRQRRSRRESHNVSRFVEESSHVVLSSRGRLMQENGHMILSS